MDEDGARSQEPSSAEAGRAVHIHKPKPITALAEFLSEIGVIVVGILIALGWSSPSIRCTGTIRSSCRSRR